MSSLLRRLVTCVSASALALVPVAARANPLDGQVVGGTATIAGQGTSLVTIDQSSQRAIINWQSFNIAPGETTQFVQPGASSVTLNRVTGGLGASQINGIIDANGGIYVVNPDGILFGPSAKVNVGSFLGTTHDIANSDFMAGNYNFTISGNPSASIVNEGTITAANGGFAALVAPGVRNDGIITANLGTVALASGNAFTLDLYGDNLITLQPSDAIAAAVIDVATGQTLTSLVQNTGKLKANGGTVSLTAVAALNVLDSVINSSGVIAANSVGTKNGLVVFGAATAATKPAGAPVQNVKVAGRISAAGRQANTTGGKIEITGENIQLTGATLDASGQGGGGTVLIGGVGHSGAGVAIPVATEVTVDAASIIEASAIDAGNGGTVVVWSNGDTSFAGTIRATGGASSGNGGFVETSGHTLDIDGASVSTAAPAGQAGQWLLDPDDFTIDSAAASTIVGNLASTDVTITTSASGTGGSGDITVTAPVVWSDANSLTLSAYRNIAVDADISNSGGASVNLRADNSGTGVGTVSFADGAVVSTAGDVSIFYNPSVNPAGSVVNNTSYVNPTENFSGDVTGGGQLRAYMLVNSVYDLQNVQNNLSGTYALGTNIDASATASWNEGAGFVPIGSYDLAFAGTFNGNGNTISNLAIDMPSESGVGLFGDVGFNGMIENVGLIGGSVTGYAAVGPLVGDNSGTVTQSYATGEVNGSGGDDVGGLVGFNFGTVTQSYATGAVSGPYDVGGLVGDNRATVALSYATGPVSGGSSYFDFGVGGLVGYMYGGSITQSYATGAVNGNYAAGGLVGWSFGSVKQSYATGTVNGSTDVGGLIGYNDYSVTQSYATGAVTGTGDSTVVGGLVGFNGDDGAVTESYWDITTSGIGSQNGFGNVTNASGVTGLTTSQFSNASNFVGWNFGTVPNAAGCTAGTAACWVIVDADGSLNNAGAAAGATRPFLLSEYSTTITNAHQLQLMALNPGATYTLANNIDLGPALANASDLWGPNGTAGFVPIGNLTTNFTGTFNGQGNTISNLVINSPANYSVGLFGWVGASGAIANVGLIGGSVSGGTGSAGGLVGFNYGIVSKSYATDTVSGSDSSQWVGGLVGYNDGTVSQSYATGAVSGSYNFNLVGGLVGLNDGTVSQSYATGAVSSSYYSVGGLVGLNYGTISQSYATGTVSGGDSSYGTGGLVGWNSFAGNVVQSYATGAVNGGSNSSAGGLVGNNSGGSIATSYATGAVEVGANSTAGGLAGSNDSATYINNGIIVFSGGGSITGSYATGAVSSAGINVILGGLVGYNDTGAVITNSQAYGVVSATGTVTSQNNCSENCQYINAGGLVGQNYGTISGPSWETAPTACSAGYTCYSGTVTVGSQGLAGGLVGYNDGIVTNAFAIANVGGAAGFATTIGNNNDNETDLGGLVGENSGQITSSFASGTVGSLTTADLQVGGLVASNHGTITGSFASVVVSAGDNSMAGGLVGENSPNDNSNCDGCYVGDGDNNSAAIVNSNATGNVTAGASSIVGGLAGYTGGNSGSLGGGSVLNTIASGAVTAGGNSIVGGLAGVAAGAISSSSAENTLVASTGSNSIVGGLVGFNAGSVATSSSTAPVSGGADSYIGGLFGINVGSVSNSEVDPLIAATGDDSVTGGIAGLNVGSIDSTNAEVAITSSDGAFVGGVAGINGTYTNFTSIIPNSSFPTGTITNSTATGTGFSSLVGTTTPATEPAIPAWLGSCTAQLCTILNDGILQTATPEETNPIQLIANLQATDPGLVSCNSGSTANFGLNTTGGEGQTQVAINETWQNFARAIVGAGALQKSVAADDLEAARRQLKQAQPANADAMALASRIGSTIVVQNQVDEVVGAKKNRIAVGDDVFADEIVQTGEDSNGKLLFTDDTNLAIGPTSTVKLDRFVFSGDKDYSTAVINLTKGAFRFITGNSQKSAYQIRTPVATVGVRGTIVDIKIANGNTTVALQEGNALVCPLGKTQCVDLAPGQSAVVTTTKASRTPSGWSFASACTGNSALCTQTKVASATSGTQQVALGSSGAAIQCDSK